MTQKSSNELMRGAYRCTSSRVQTLTAFKTCGPQATSRSVLGLPREIIGPPPPSPKHDPRSRGHTVLRVWVPIAPLEAARVTSRIVQARQCSSAHTGEDQHRGRAPTLVVTKASMSSGLRKMDMKSRPGAQLAPEIHQADGGTAAEDRVDAPVGLVVDVGAADTAGVDVDPAF
jgi:hypothetical protein